MAAQNLRTLVEMDQKKLSFESSVNESQKQLISVVQTDGVLVFERKKPITKEMVSATQGDTEKLLSHSHQGLISEMEFIFTTAKKILEKPSSHMCFATGVILLTRGFYNDAIQQFQKSVELDPGHIQAIKHYGIALTLKGDYDNALHVFNHILESGPAYADVYYYLGNVYLFQRQFEKAKQHYGQAVKINPNYADAHLRLATCAVAVIAGENNNLVEAAVQGYVEEAQRETQLALDSNSRVMSGALLTGTANLKSGKYQMAFKNYLEARPKYSPKTGSEVVYFYTLKLLYGDKGVSSQETEEYVRQLEQLVETNPSYVDLRLHYGMGTLMKSNFLIHRSLKEMNKAIEVNPNFQQAKTTADTLTDIYK
ncbi:MAG TPA: tetratricopeptide repeat protein, partial [bacterium]|nr:tetratricopeptide repeat protein [bacterium]